MAASLDRPWRTMGAHLARLRGSSGVEFRVWAPRARQVSVVGDFCDWDPRRWPMAADAEAGTWTAFVPGIGPGATYAYSVVGADGVERRKADPWGQRMQHPPATASIVAGPAQHRWRDGEWVRARAASDPQRLPMYVYEVHLGSWRRDAAGRWLGYVELGEQLAAHCTELGFTHVELLPIAEHPFDGSWGYQVTGYFAPTARFGTPDELRAMIDTLHRAGIGVLLDWVPGHFPRDAHALGRFDGAPLYEHADALRAAHPDWGTLEFDYGRPEVREFLIANARYWIDEFHVDGLRVDAVASMLYLDYSRAAGEWTPNALGGNTDLEAIAFLGELTDAIHAEWPGVLVIAEESTAFPGVTRPAAQGGLGFDLKWDLGWMHDTLKWLEHNPAWRRRHRDRLTFRGMYLGSERWLLPLSHDEVVYGKRSLLRKMPGDETAQFAQLRSLLANQVGQPGKQLLFMGTELAPAAEWNHDGALPWDVRASDEHRHGLRRCLQDLAALYRSTPALWASDPDPDGFAWIDGGPPPSVLAWLRRSGSEVAVVVQNLANVRRRHQLGLPQPGRWREALNTDSAHYAGGNVGNGGSVTADEVPAGGQPASALVTLPPYGTLILVPG